MFIPRPTGGGMLFILAALIALGTAFMNVGLVTALIAALMSGFVLSGFLLSFFAAAGFEVRREPVLEGNCLEKISLPLTVRNRTFWYRQPCVITEKLPFYPGGRANWAVPALRPHEKILLERSFTAIRRGHFHLKKLQLIAGDPCGLFQVRKTFRLRGEIAIMPQIRSLESPDGGDGGHISLTGEGRPRGHAGNGSDFFGVRPYRAGDEIRHIHWRLSAAKQKLMIREFEATAIEKVFLILDSNAALVGQDPAENNFEALVSLAASITDYFSAHYCMLSFFTSLDNHFIQFNGDAAGIRLKILELLTELQPGRNRVENLLAEVLESIPPGSVLYLLSMSDPPELKNMLRLLEDQDVRLQWVCAAKEYFPIVSEDEPREMLLPAPEERYPQVFGPRLLTFQTVWEKLFRDDELDEKI